MACSRRAVEQRRRRKQRRGPSGGLQKILNCGELRAPREASFDEEVEDVQAQLLVAAMRQWRLQSTARRRRASLGFRPCSLFPERERREGGVRKQGREEGPGGPLITSSQRDSERGRGSRGTSSSGKSARSLQRREEDDLVIFFRKPPWHFYFCYGQAPGSFSFLFY